MIFVKISLFKIFIKILYPKFQTTFFIFTGYFFLFAHTLIFVFVKFTQNLRQVALRRRSTHQVFCFAFSFLFCLFSLVFSLFWCHLATPALPPLTGGILGFSGVWWCGRVSFVVVSGVRCFVLVVSVAWVWWRVVVLLLVVGRSSCWWLSSCWWWCFWVPVPQTTFGFGVAGGLWLVLGGGCLLSFACPFWLLLSFCACLFFVLFCFFGSSSSFLPLDFCAVLCYTY